MTAPPREPMKLWCADCGAEYHGDNECAIVRAPAPPVAQPAEPPATDDLDDLVRRLMNGDHDLQITTIDRWMREGAFAITALRATVERQAREIADECEMRRTFAEEWRKEKARAERAEAERDALREELASVLTDWNAIVRASGSPTNGGAVGHVIAMRAERDALRECVQDMLECLEPLVRFVSPATRAKFAEVLDAARAKMGEP